MKKVFRAILIVSLGFSASACEEMNCNIIYHSNTDQAINRDVVEKSEIANLKLQEPVRKGYTFAGWYLDSEFSKEYSPNEIINGSNELYAKWNINSYNIVVHNGEEILEYNFDYNDVINLNPVIKDDYIFDGYYLDEELTVEFDLVNMPAHDLELYPKFSPILHYFMFVYYANNDEHYDSVTLERNELNSLKLPEPTREGYAFEGWFFDSNFENEFSLENAEEGVNSLYAKWSVNSYRITIFNDNELIDYEFNFGDAIRIAPLEKYDYAFEGYYLDEELTVEFNLVNMPSRDIYLFPKFSKILHYYSFFFIVENGEYYKPITLERDNLDSLELPVPTKEGYTFEGWYLDSEYSKVFDLEKTNEGNNELFAKWEVNSYKVVVHNDEENIEYMFDFGDAIRVDPVTKYDYSFDGYFTDEGLTEKFGFGSMPSHDVHLFPKFKKILHYYTFVYHTDNGGNFPAVTLERSVLNTLELPIPYKEGYTFEGWYVDATLVNEFDINDAIEGNNELYAKWRVNQYELLVHNNGEITNYVFNYGEELNLPTIRNIEHSFAGYYLDENYNNKLAFSTMPAQNLELYVKYCEHVWHKGTSSSYDVYCVKCGFRSLPVININTPQEIEREYVNTEVSVDAGNSYYDINNASCKVKVRGNSTATFPKKPYRLKFDEKQKMLGLNNDLEAKSWVLLAEWQGYTVSNFLALNISKQILGEDYYCSDCTFVILKINNEYNGIYLLAEQQQINKGRVEINEVDKNYEGVDIGYLVELDARYETEEYYFAMDYRHDLLDVNGDTVYHDKNIMTYSIKSDIYSDAQVEYIHKTIQNIYDIMYDALYEDHTDLAAHPYKTLDSFCNLVDDYSINSAKEAISKVVDYESLLRTAILQEMLENHDVGFSSFYFSFDASKEQPKLTFEAPWDFDIAYGTGFGTEDFENSPYLFTKTTKTYPERHNMWFMLFANCDWFGKDLKDKYEELDVRNIVYQSISKLDSFVHDNVELIYDNYLMWNDSIYFVVDDYDYFSSKFVSIMNVFPWFLWRKCERFERFLERFTVKESFSISFTVDSLNSIMIYEGKDYTVYGIITDNYGLNDMSGDGQINFKVIVPEGYEIDSINIVGSYKNLKDPSDTGAENVYRITKVASDLNITVTFRAI